MAAPIVEVLGHLRFATVAVGTKETKATDSNLSERELTLLRLVAGGLTDRIIGDVLFVSSRTMTTHVARIMDKLGVESRSAAATLAVRRGYIS